MKDINNPLMTAYFKALDGQINNPDGAGKVRVFIGEEPNDIDDQYYIVINDVSSSDVSPKSLNQHNANVQVTINSWKKTYNGGKGLNTVAGKVLEIIKPTPKSKLQAAGIDIITTSLQRDNTQNYGYLADRTYVSKNLIFSHLISY